MNHGPLFLPVAYSDVEDVAVAIMKSGTFYHLGLLYRDTSDAVQFIDLTISGVESHPASSELVVAWAVPHVNKLLRLNTAAFCEHVAKQRPKVYYGFNYIPPSFVARDGSLVPSPGTVGFTCATFVLAILHNTQIELIKHLTWKKRPADEESQKKIYSLILRHQIQCQIPAEVVSSNLNEIPCIRYRPEEVLCGALSTSGPIDFDYAVANAPNILKWVETLDSVVSRRANTNRTSANSSN